MLAPIAEDRTKVVCPIIDVIDDKTLAYSNNGGYQIGGFSWSLHFTWQDVEVMGRNTSSVHYTDPIR